MIVARARNFVVALLLLTIVGVLGPPTVFLARVWWTDGSTPLPIAPVGTNDASRLNATRPGEVILVASDLREAEQQLVSLVKRATEQKLVIMISGARHSMGGHALYPGGIALNMDGFNRMSLDAEHRILTVGSGARWSQVIPFLDQHGLAVAVMQSNNDFSVGGSLSVNCHGWQNDSPPISSTVESFRLLTASGVIVRCSREENTELFSLVLGGYGLFGVILDVNLRVVPNEFYEAEPHTINATDYARVYHELTRARNDIGMAYGRINVAPDGFMEDAIITLLRRKPTSRSTTNTLTERPLPLLKRLVFRGGIGSDYGKNLRWHLEKSIGELGGDTLSRNQIMNEPSGWYAARTRDASDILHEYFIPTARLSEFIASARPVLQKHRPDLLNITVRNVSADRDTFLRYANEEVFGLVMLFHQHHTPAAEAAMEALTRDLIDTALACGGRYYLPYRGHATRQQFALAYPHADEFFALKRHHDPAGIFQNSFYRAYANSPTE